jgi:uncharacterized membrane protein YkoI
MNRKLATAAGVALAGIVGLGVTAWTTAQGAGADAEAQAETREIAAVGTTKVGLPDAIAAAEAGSGGKVVEAGLEAEGDRPVFYDLLVRKADGLASVHVDPATGAVVSTGKTRPGNPRRVLIEDPKIDLGQAVRAAEAAAGGKALEGGIERRGGAPTYVVEIVREGEVSVHVVDPASGQVSAAGG